MRRTDFPHKPMILILSALAWTLAASARQASLAQGPVYDTVSVKPHKAGDNSMRVSTAADGYSGSNISIKMLIQSAYNLKTSEQIVGLPGPVDSASFDIQARMDPEAVAVIKALSKEESASQRRLMMQALLADRFHLKVHHETREQPMYELLLARGGTKLKPADPNDTYANGIKGPDGNSRPGMMMISNGKLTAQGIPIASLVANLSMQLHREVLDRTGLTGNYDIALQWSDEESSGDAKETGAPSAPSIFTALPEQLGLRLNSIKGPADTIVIDHVDMPSEN